MCAPGTLDHPLVDLPGQKTQRKADHAALVPEHALDREVRLAGIGGPENGRDAARAQLREKGATSHTWSGRNPDGVRRPFPKRRAAWMGRSGNAPAGSPAIW